VLVENLAVRMDNQQVDKWVVQMVVMTEIVMVGV